MCWLKEKWPQVRSFPNLLYPDYVNSIEIGSISRDSRPWLVRFIGWDLNIPERSQSCTSLTNEVLQSWKACSHKISAYCLESQSLLKSFWRQKNLWAYLKEYFLQLKSGNTARVSGVFHFLGITCSDQRIWGLPYSPKLNGPSKLFLQRHLAKPHLE